MSSAVLSDIDFGRLGPPPGARILIVGGCGGLGRMVVKAAIETGLKVAVFDQARSIDEWTPPNDVELVVPVDATSEADVERAFARLDAAWTGLDGLVNFAGIAPDMSTVEKISLDRESRGCELAVGASRVARSNTSAASWDRECDRQHSVQPRREGDAGLWTLLRCEERDHRSYKSDRDRKCAAYPRQHDSAPARSGLPSSPEVRAAIPPMARRLRGASILTPRLIRPRCAGWECPRRLPRRCCSCSARPRAT